MSISSFSDTVMHRVCTNILQTCFGSVSSAESRCQLLRLKVLHVCYPPGSNCFRSIHLLREHECQRKTTESGVHSTYICTPYKPLLLFLMSSVVSRNKII
ncbi:uncharacterized protein LOC106875519 isoform X2 [Octopus bimaculoides]|uniref:uncharacterized protein LOC106875519 isoform X2 n=1 Tax=Octopus bimaculoides TaxID=37653 RepID=UPI0022E08BF4|nr:uncharacterized protein LOC106875519 isoform X2 [Octopus bimaculoides]